MSIDCLIHLIFYPKMIDLVVQNYCSSLNFLEYGLLYSNTETDEKLLF